MLGAWVQEPGCWLAFVVLGSWAVLTGGLGGLGGTADWGCAGGNEGGERGLPVRLHGSWGFAAGQLYVAATGGCAELAAVSRGTMLVGPVRSLHDIKWSMWLRRRSSYTPWVPRCGVTDPAHIRRCRMQSCGHIRITPGSSPEARRQRHFVQGKQTFTGPEHHLEAACMGPSRAAAVASLPASLMTLEASC